ncbi:hypothetical protein CEB3_c25670 [Peptococcaceae bacterium CEB3]|nr:hypothetical protein CEB3_c25670 [Peptococcaceae bacterium CEB3]
MGRVAMERKVTKIGNSLGVTMTDALKQLGLKNGDTVTVDVRDDEIVIRKSQYVPLPEGIGPDFFDVLNSVMDQYHETLQGLKDR